MDSGAPWRGYSERPGWPQRRPAAICATVGGLLTLVTTVLCISNVVSTQQAIALAIPAVLITLGGWFGVIVPDALIAWRRGFQLGYEAAIDNPAPGDSSAATPAVPTGVRTPAVTDLVSWGKRRSGRIQLS
jgi:hypothetical protein